MFVSSHEGIAVNHLGGFWTGIMISSLEKIKQRTETLLFTILSILKGVTKQDGRKCPLRQPKSILNISTLEISTPLLLLMMVEKFSGRQKLRHYV
jgi:hypothetical protein